MSDKEKLLIRCCICGQEDKVNLDEMDTSPNDNFVVIPQLWCTKCGALGQIQVLRTCSGD